MNDLTPMTDLPLHICVDTVWLRCFDALAQGAVVPDGLAGMWRTCLTVPASEDEMLVQGCSALGLSNSATMVLAILARIETDPRLARLVSACQSGDGDARPTPELLCRALGALETAVSVSDLVHGSLMRSGAVRPMPSKAPLAVTPLMLSAPMLWALGISPDAPLQAMELADVMPPQTYLEHAGGVASDPAPRCTVLRGGTAADQRLWAQAVAQSVGKTCVSLDQCYGEKEGHGDRIAGLGAALTFANGLPVETCKAAPGQRAKLIPLDGYTGPRLVLAGQDGGVEAGMWPVVDVSLPRLKAAERTALWDMLAPEFTDAKLPSIGAGRLCAVATRMRAANSDFRTAAGAEARLDIEPHGRLVTARVEAEQMIAAQPVQEELDMLALRCALRDGTGVRAVLSGPSGSGKTMACTWLSTKLEQPLLKVDLASVVSKYIGETEENLARILDQAEAADVILLFDEADSLFGARTEAKDSSDRYANSQTNYLLSRIETHSGIVLLTTNGLQRMDSAFARRLDQMIDVPLPDARQRLQLWTVYLDQGHSLTPQHIQRLARLAEIAGGHIRAICETALIIATQNARAVGFVDVVRAVQLGYRGMGRTAPSLGEAG